MTHKPGVEMDQEQTPNGEGTSEVQTPEGVAEATNTGSEPDVQTLKAKIAEHEKLIDKLRRHERESLKREEQAIKKASELETKFREDRVNAALLAELHDAVDTKALLKLADKSAIKYEGDEVDAESLKNVVLALRTEYSSLFKQEPRATSVKRPSEGETTGGFEKELRMAKTHKEIENVMRKFGKL